MKRYFLLTAAGAALVLAQTNRAKAELVFGFNDSTLNGFTNPTPAYDQDGTATVSQSTTTGVSEGTGALHINVGPTGGGYDQIDVTTTQFSQDLVNPATNTLSLTAAANYNNAGYITLAPEFYIDGTTDGTSAFGTKLLFPSTTLFYDNGVATNEAYTFGLTIKDPYATARPANYQGNGQPATPADGDSTTTKYTPGHIAAQILAALQVANPSATGAVDAFGFEETTNTASGNPNAADTGDDLFVDDVTIPDVSAVPEPTSLMLAGIPLGGLLLRRRRRLA